MRRLLGRDFRLARTAAGTFWMASVVFLVICSLFAISLGGTTQILSALAPSVVWASAVLASTMTASSVFSDDHVSGAIDYLRLEGHSLTSIVMSKIIVTTLILLSPLLASAAIASEMFGLNFQTTSSLLWSLLLGGPALIGYSVFAGALLTGWGRGNLLALLLTIPLMLPTVIFGEAAASSDTFSTEHQALIGLSLISIVLSVVASSAALAVNAE